MRISLISILFFTVLFKISAQEILIDSIIITGNKRTKERVILRELTFKAKDSLNIKEGFESIVSYNEKRLLSIGLFNHVKISFTEDPNHGNEYNVHIVVNENWYLFPSPIFELADRNFNLWWYELNRDITRVNYGLRGEHVNLTGNRDKLTLTAQLGYTRKLELKYHFPFLDAKGNWTASFNAYYSDVKEMAYKTVGNKTQFGSYNDEVMQTRIRIGGDIGYRQNLYLSHIFRLEFHKNTINDYAATILNPDYFLNSDTKIEFFFFNYTLFYDNREFRIFPEAGDYFHLNFKKEGLYIFNDYDNMSLALEYEKYFNYKSKLIWNFRGKVKANLIRNKLAFANNSAFGWGEDLLRGYDLYAIDGSDFAYLKLGINYKFFERKYDLSNVLHVSQFNKIDLKLYFGIGFDSGYVNERDYIETNNFSNRIIYGYGPSFGLMLYNTYLFSIDYSWNHTGEGGIFVRNKISF